MVTKVNGPGMEDYKRALKAAKWAGVKAVRIEIGNGAIVLIMDDLIWRSWHWANLPHRN